MTPDRKTLLDAAGRVMRKLNDAQVLVRGGEIRRASKMLISAAVELTTLSLRAGELAEKQPAPKRVAKAPEPN